MTSWGERPPTATAEKLLDRLSFGAGMAVAWDDMLGKGLIIVSAK